MQASRQAPKSDRRGPVPQGARRSPWGKATTRYVTSMYILAITLLACNEAARAPTPPAPTPAAPAPPPAATPAETAAARVVFLGDSITAGAGLGEGQAYPALLERSWAEEGLRVAVVNAGVSGDTTAGGRRRLDWLLGQQPDVVVVALGANDMLRGLAPEEIEANLRAILTGIKAAGAEAILLGMRANPTLGPDYATAFEAIYPRLATELSVPLLPFLLEGVAGDPRLNQADGIHPTAEGQAAIAKLVAPTVAPVLRAKLSGN